MKTKTFTLITFAILGLCNAYSQVGIGTTTPDESTSLELQSTEKGFLPPRLTTAQRNDNIANPAEGLLIYNTDNNSLEFFDGLQWINSTNSVITSGPCAGESSVLSFKDLTYKPVPNADQCWLDRNLGASQVATTLDDADAYGDLYQWGRAADGHEKRSSQTYNAVLSTDGVSNFDNNPANAWHGQFILRSDGDEDDNWVGPNWVNPSVSGVDNLWQGVNGTNNPCPAGFRVPTEAEWQAEISSWSAGDFASPLKLPRAGNRDYSHGEVINESSFGFYWSSTIAVPISSGDSGREASSIYFDSSFILPSNFFSSSRANGYSVRCIKD